jgi:hypothetical protein
MPSVFWDFKCSTVLVNFFLCCHVTLGRDKVGRKNLPKNEGDLVSTEKVSKMTF